MSGRRFRGGRLRHRRLQAVLAALGLSIAVALPVILISVGSGVSDHELGELESTGYQIAISAPGAHGISDAHQVAAELSGIGSVSEVSPVLSVAVDLYRSSCCPIPLLVEGVLPGPFGATLPPEEKGLFPSPLPLGDPEDAAHYANGSYAGPSAGRILLSSPVADAHRIAVGATVELAPSPGAPGRNFTVGGVFGVPPTLLGPTGAFAALLPLSDLQILAGLALGPNGTLLDAADTVEVALGGAAATSPGDVARVAGEIGARFPYFAVSTLDQEVSQAENAAAILDGFYLALSSAALAVGLLFLALVLVRRVDADRPLIAVRRAIGVPGRSIAGELAGTAVVLSAVSVLGGFALGLAAVQALDRFGSASVQAASSLAVFDPVTLGAIGAAVVALGALASVAATREALRISIPEALR